MGYVFNQVRKISLSNLHLKFHKTKTFFSQFVKKYSYFSQDLQKYT